MLKRRSDQDILQFIRDLPGGNVPQYAKLLNTTAIRISNLLTNNVEGQKIAKAGLVLAAERGMLPVWSFKDDRGSLRARDVDEMSRNGKLPPFIAKLLSEVHPNFRDDALNFLREALDQTSSHRSFEEQMTSYMDQDRHRTDHIMDQQAVIEARDAEIKRFDYVIQQATKMAGIIEDQTQRQAERLNIDPSAAIENTERETADAV